MKKIKTLVAAAVLVASTSSFAVPVFANTVTAQNSEIATEASLDDSKLTIKTKDPVEAKDNNGYKLTFNYHYDKNDFIIENSYSNLYEKSLKDYFKDFGDKLIKDSNDSNRPKIEAELLFDSGTSSLYKVTYFVMEREPGLFGKHYIQPYTIEVSKDKHEGIDDQVPTYNINLSDQTNMQLLKNKLGEAVATQGYKVEHSNVSENGVYKVKVTKDGITVANINLYEETVSYSTHVQNIGWQDSKSNGQMAGTEGQALRLEGIKLNLANMPEGSAIQYRTHVQNLGWQDWKSNGEASGSEGQALRLEGIEIKLSDDLAKYYDVEYRTHVENLGWQDWVKNGEMSGTEGQALRLEGIEVRLVAKIAH